MSIPDHWLVDGERVIISPGFCRETIEENQRIDFRMGSGGYESSQSSMVNGNWSDVLRHLEVNLEVGPRLV